VLLTVAVVLADFLAVLLGAHKSSVDVAFTAMLAALPPLAWWAVARAPAQLRRPFRLLALASTLWLVGTLVWYAYYLDEGNRIPRPPGPWDAFFIAAYLLVLASLWQALRPVIPLGRAALDVSIVGAALLALGVAAVAPGLSHGISAQSTVTALRPLFGMVALMLVGSALLGSWAGLPLSIVLIGLGQVCLTIGSFVYSVRSISGDVVADDPWATFGWFAGLCLSILATLVIALRLDRPLRAVRGKTIPGVPGSARSVIAVSLGALATTIAVAVYGIVAGSRSTVLAGLLATGWTGVAMAGRARGAIRDLEVAYERLDGSHLALERAHDRLAEMNEQLAAANVEIRAVHEGFEDLLVLADERTGGGLRDLIEQTGDDLAGFFARYLGRSS
jgi:hypothetical protein